MPIASGHYICNGDCLAFTIESCRKFRCQHDWWRRKYVRRLPKVSKGHQNQTTDRQTLIVFMQISFPYRSYAQITIALTTFSNMVPNKGRTWAQHQGRLLNAGASMTHHTTGKQPVEQTSDVGQAWRAATRLVRKPGWRRSLLARRITQFLISWATIAMERSSSSGVACCVVVCIPARTHRCSKCLLAILGDLDLNNCFQTFVRFGVRLFTTRLICKTKYLHKLHQK